MIGLLDLAKAFDNVRHGILLIHGLRAIYSVDSSMLVFKDACLNGVRSLLECPRAPFWVHYFFYICKRFTHSCEASDEYVC